LIELKVARPKAAAAMADSLDRKGKRESIPREIKVAVRQRDKGFSVLTPGNNKRWGPPKQRKPPIRGETPTSGNRPKRWARPKVLVSPVRFRPSPFRFLGRTHHSAGYSRPVGRTDRSRRLIAATPAALYQALVEQEALERWLPPEGMAGRIDRFDPGPGGGFRMELTYRDPAGSLGKTSASGDVTEVEFASVEPDARVVWRIDFASEDPAYAGTMTMTWALTEVEGGTEVSVEAEDVPPGISAPDHEAGIASSLRNLAAYLESPDG
jgi:uncharacterized protein YndB with AHSA1/START domain